VVLREELCTGCGACAKACPWDAVHMAARAGGALLATKCDLCATTARAEPACVDACPTRAIARIDPGARAPRPAPRGPGASVAVLAVASAAAACALARAPAFPWMTGAVAGASVLALGAHGAWKRLVRARGHAAYVVHVGLAPFAVVAVIRHATPPDPHAAGGVAGALLAACVVALATGLAGALAYALAPRRLARLELRGATPEDLATRATELEARAFAQLTGRSESAKAVVARVLGPYARSRLGALAMAARGTPVARAEEALHARLAAILGDRAARIDGLAALVRTAVETRATKAERALQAALRAWLAPHVVAATLALALLALHVAIEVAHR
jgi:NAD-dependent dihydropyrimidine dehydrogenase PreA subunit